MTAPNVILMEQAPATVCTVTQFVNGVIEVEQIAPPKIETVLGGIPGPRGEPGPTGPPGPSGGTPTLYPVVGITSWYQVHSYPYPPPVRLVDEWGNAVDVGVEYPDLSHVYIEFPTPFTGTIILN